ncbi:hypothetical protein B9C88_01370 [Brevibacillus laterosporus]|uniref:hypothetical protein n=1 Tax=Brevibacillus laterosporus TaxID=1465 RepID=UPI000BC3BA7E|nr:hypothetical protein [Brevibacillus laterosporus]PCN46188.1 hypothetical protein B9C88_01370 [Brevibacillus laterosporus]
MKKSLAALMVSTLLASMYFSPAYAATKATGVDSKSITNVKSLDATVSDPNRFNGLRVKVVDEPTVFLIMDGKKRGIVSETVYFRLFRSWDGIQSFLSLDGIPDGPVINENTQLIKYQNNPTVYLIDHENGRTVKRGFVSEAAFNKYSFDWNKIITLPDSLQNTIPDGTPITH